MASILLSIICLLAIAQSTENVISSTPAEDRKLRIKFEFDPTLPRLGNTGTPETIPPQNAGQNPSFGRMSVHWIELVPAYLTPLGNGEVIYTGPQYNNQDGIIDHEQAIVSEEGVFWLNISLSDILPNKYLYIRTSVAYQEYTAQFNLVNNLDEYITTTYPSIPTSGIAAIEKGTGYIQSFLGVNTHIKTIENQGFSLNVNANKLQGFWTFVTEFENAALNEYKELKYGDGTPGATTVPNILPAEIPAGSCIVVGEIAGNGLIIPDAPDNNADNLPDIALTLRYSVNNSFEWIDFNQNDELDWYYLVDVNTGVPDTVTIANQSEPIVDMGTRGLWPYVEDLERIYVDDDGSDGTKPSGAKQFGFMSVVVVLIVSILMK